MGTATATPSRHASTASATTNGRADPQNQQTRNTFRDREEEALTKFLGWFSVGLGLAEVAAPRLMAKVIGLRRPDGILPAFGLRELATGVGILTNRRPAEWIWGRVVGDMMDLAYLGNALFSPKTDKIKVLSAAAAVAGVTALDIFCGQQLSARPGRAQMPPQTDRGIQVRAGVTVNASADVLYRYWREIENLPRIMRYLKSVTPLDEKRSRWEAPAPAGMKITWEAEIVKDEPDRCIAWRSVSGQAPNSGQVTFRPAAGNRGTVIEVDLRYEPPLGAFGAILAFLFGREPRQQIMEDLRAYKAFVETGEVPTISGQTSGRQIMS